MIVGQDRAVDQFASAWRRGALHHAWLIAGQKGVGKATFAREAATRVLADAAGPKVEAPGLSTPEDHRIARLVEAGSHPDLRWLERLTNDKTNNLARNITVDQVRRLGDLFDLTRGDRAGRRFYNQITLFKSVGTALEDLAAAQYAVEVT